MKLSTALKQTASLVGTRSGTHCLSVRGWRPCFWNMRTSRKKEGGVAISVFEAFPHWLQLLEPAYFKPICNTSPCRVFARRGALTLLRKNQLKENNSAGESPPPPSPMRLKQLEGNVHFSEGSPDWADCEKNHSPDSKTEQDDDFLWTDQQDGPVKRL